MNYWVIPIVKGRYDHSMTIKNGRGEDIVEVVLKHYDLTEDFLKKRCREQKIVQARQICFYFLRKYTTLSLKEIGLIFGLDHTTVMHGIIRLRGLMDTEEGLRDEMKVIQQSIY